MSKIIRRDMGINWVWYIKYDLDKKNQTATIVDSWREHLYDSSRNEGCPSHEGAKDYRLRTGHDISQWREDGKPGGFNGCRDNYRVVPTLKVDDIDYLVVEIDKDGSYKRD